MNNCRPQEVTILSLVIVTLCVTLTTILITARRQIGYKKLLNKYVRRYGDIVKYDPPV